MRDDRPSELGILGLGSVGEGFGGYWDGWRVVVRCWGGVERVLGLGWQVL